MLGVIVNVITVVIGSCIGLLFKKGIPEKVSNAAMTGLGACTLYIGITGSLSGENVLILIAAVVLGAIVGTLLNIDGAINTLAGKVEARFSGDGKKVSIAEGLVSATLLFCVGSMTVTGSIQAGIISPLLSAGAVNEMTCAGSLLIIMIGTNLMGITKIKVADFLPAIIFAPVIYNILPLIEYLWKLLF